MPEVDVVIRGRGEAQSTVERTAIRIATQRSESAYSRAWRSYPGTLVQRGQDLSVISVDAEDTSDYTEGYEDISETVTREGPDIASARAAAAAGARQAFDDAAAAVDGFTGSDMIVTSFGPTVAADAGTQLVAETRTENSRTRDGAETAARTSAIAAYRESAALVDRYTSIPDPRVSVLYGGARPVAEIPAAFGTVNASGRASNLNRSLAEDIARILCRSSLEDRLPDRASWAAAENYEDPEVFIRRVTAYRSTISCSRVWEIPAIDPTYGQATGRGDGTGSTAAAAEAAARAACRLVLPTGARWTQTTQYGTPVTSLLGTTYYVSVSCSRAWVIPAVSPLTDVASAVGTGTGPTPAAAAIAAKAVCALELPDGANWVGGHRYSAASDRLLGTIYHSAVRCERAWVIPAGTPTIRDATHSGTGTGTSRELAIAAAKADCNPILPNGATWTGAIEYGEPIVGILGTIYYASVRCSRAWVIPGSSGTATHRGTGTGSTEAAAIAAAKAACNPSLPTGASWSRGISYGTPVTGRLRTTYYVSVSCSRAWVIPAGEDTTGAATDSHTVTGYSTEAAARSAARAGCRPSRPSGASWDGPLIYTNTTARPTFSGWSASASCVRSWRIPGTPRESGTARSTGSGQSTSSAAAAEANARSNCSLELPDRAHWVAAATYTVTNSASTSDWSASVDCSRPWSIPRQSGTRSSTGSGSGSSPETALSNARAACSISPPNGASWAAAATYTVTGTGSSTNYSASVSCSREYSLPGSNRESGVVRDTGSGQGSTRDAARQAARDDCNLELPDRASWVSDATYTITNESTTQNWWASVTCYRTWNRPGRARQSDTVTDTGSGQGSDYDAALANARADCSLERPAGASWAAAATYRVTGTRSVSRYASSVSCSRNWAIGGRTRRVGTVRVTGTATGITAQDAEADAVQDCADKMALPLNARWTDVAPKTGVTRTAPYQANFYEISVRCSRAWASPRVPGYTLYAFSATASAQVPYDRPASAEATVSGRALWARTDRMTFLYTVVVVTYATLTYDVEDDYTGILYRTATGWVILGPFYNNESWEAPQPYYRKADGWHKVGV